MADLSSSAMRASRNIASQRIAAVSKPSQPLQNTIPAPAPPIVSQSPSIIQGDPQQENNPIVVPNAPVNTPVNKKEYYENLVNEKIKEYTNNYNDNVNYNEIKNTPDSIPDDIAYVKNLLDNINTDQYLLNNNEFENQYIIDDFNNKLYNINDVFKQKINDYYEIVNKLKVNNNFLNIYKIKNDIYVDEKIYPIDDNGNGNNVYKNYLDAYVKMWLMLYLRIKLIFTVVEKDYNNEYEDGSKFNDFIINKYNEELNIINSNLKHAYNVYVKYICMYKRNKDNNKYMNVDQTCDVSSSRLTDNFNNNFINNPSITNQLINNSHGGKKYKKKTKKYKNKY